MHQPKKEGCAITRTGDNPKNDCSCSSRCVCCSCASSSCCLICLLVICSYVLVFKKGL
jgi:hypothetical protein